VQDLAMTLVVCAASRWPHIQSLSSPEVVAAPLIVPAVVFDVNDRLLAPE